MSTRRIKRYIVAKMREGEDMHQLIAPLSPKLKLAVMEYVEKKRSNKIMIYSHANFHIHKATHDNEWVEWEEEE